MRRRFFVKGFENNGATLSGDAAHHLGRVLRAEPGQMYELSDGTKVWLSRVEKVTQEAIEFALVEPVEARLPDVHVTLLLSIVKFDRFEWCLEKATELGVADVVPVDAARSDRPLVLAAPKRAERWSKILLESAQQARRLRPPTLHPIQSPRIAFAGVGVQTRGRGSISLLLSEQPGAPLLRSILEGKGAAAAILATGPEGGWTEEELQIARDAGYQEASLGHQILRTETAVIAGLAMLNYALGD